MTKNGYQILDVDCVGMPKFSGELFIGSHAIYQALLTNASLSVPNGFDSEGYKELETQVYKKAFEIGRRFGAYRLDRLSATPIYQAYHASYTTQDYIFRPFIVMAIAEVLKLQVLFGAMFCDGKSVVFTNSPLSILHELFKDRINPSASLDDMLKYLLKKRIITSAEHIPDLKSGAIQYWRTSFVRKVSALLDVSIHLTARLFSEGEYTKYFSKHTGYVEAAFPKAGGSSFVKPYLLQADLKEGRLFTSSAFMATLFNSKRRMKSFPKSFLDASIGLDSLCLISDFSVVSPYMAKTHPDQYFLRLNPLNVLEPQLRIDQEGNIQKRKSARVLARSRYNALFSINDTIVSEPVEMTEDSKQTNREKRAELLARVKSTVDRIHEKVEARKQAMAESAEPIEYTEADFAESIEPVEVPEVIENTKVCEVCEKTDCSNQAVPETFDTFYGVYSQLSKNMRSQIYTRIKETAFKSFEDRLRVTFNSLNGTERMRITDLAKAALMVQNELGLSGEKDADR